VPAAHAGLERESGHRGLSRFGGWGHDQVGKTILAALASTAQNKMAISIAKDNLTHLAS
jgi:hypothetical protein